MHKYRRLLQYPLQQWRSFLVIAGLTAVSSFMVALQPWPLKFLIDYALGSLPLPASVQALFEWVALQPTPSVLVLASAAATLALFSLNSVFEVILTRTWAVAGQRMVHALAADMFHHLLRLPLKFHQQRPVGDALSRLTTDAWCVYKLTDGVLISPAQKLLTLLMVGGLAWKLHAELALYAFATVPLMVGATLYFGGRIKKRTHRGREAQSRLLSFVHQTLSVMPVVQAFGTEERNWQRYQDLAADAVTVSQRGALLMRTYGLVTGLISITGAAVIIYVGGREVLMGQLSLGSFLVFIAYLRTMQSKAETFIKLYGSLKPVEASIERVLDILDTPLEAQRGHTAEPHRRLPDARTSRGVHVRFENVSFEYEPDRPVLRNVTLEARPGERIALIGPSGSGKSTLVSLIPGLHVPISGRVVVEGVDVREWSMPTLRDRIAVLLQEPFLFPVSVAENIAYGRPGASQSEIEAAARTAHADEFIRHLPQGYDTVVGERGGSLSGGERQRIAIARALLRNSPLLVLDEPTSALDARTEALVLDALEQLMAGRTTFIIAHRLSTIRRADRIVVLKTGRIVETGTHDELLARRSVYYEMHGQNTAGVWEVVER